MMDYYSQFDMPSLEERKKELLIFSKTLKHNLDLVDLDELLTTIVSKTPRYSYTGYGVFGVQEERKLLIKSLQ
jgi:hypothetical protein